IVPSDVVAGFGVGVERAAVLVGGGAFVHGRGRDTSQQAEQMFAVVNGSDRRCKRVRGVITDTAALLVLRNVVSMNGGLEGLELLVPSSDDLVRQEILQHDKFVLFEIRLT